jgi:hypothetical protein
MPIGPSFVIAGLDPAIHAASRRVYALRPDLRAPLFSMDMRVKPAYDEQ